MLMELPSISALTALKTLFVLLVLSTYAFQFILSHAMLRIVSNNELMMFPTDYFENAMSLETLLADHNQLAMLEDDAFAHMPMLTFL